MRLSHCILPMALTALACSDSTGLDEDVEIVASLRGENYVVLTIENRGSQTVYYHKAWLERHEDGDWERFDPPTTDELPVRPIEPGENYVVAREIVLDGEAPPPEPGEYRFRVNMSEDGSGNIPSENAETSNTFEIGAAIVFAKLRLRWTGSRLATQIASLPVPIGSPSRTFGRVSPSVRTRPRRATARG